MTLNWTAPVEDGGSPVTNYTVWRGNTAETLQVLEIIGNVTSYQDPTVEPNATYYYAVNASNTAGGGNLSQTVNVTIPGDGPGEGPGGEPGPAPPSPPQNLTAQPGPGDGNISLSWDPPSDDGGDPITQYTLYRGTDPGALSPVQTLGADQLQFLDEEPAPGVTYHYQVSASNGAGEGNRSTMANATAPDGSGGDGGDGGAPPPENATVPSAPQSLNVTPGPNGGDLTLSWQPPADDGGANLTGYRLYRAVDGGDLSLRDSLPAEQTQFVDQALPEGNYTYAVSAENAVGEGNRSSNVTGQVAPSGGGGGGGGGTGSCDSSDPSCDDGGGEPCDPSDPSCDDGGSFGPPPGPSAWFGGVVNITITIGGAPVNQSADVFLQPSFDPDSGMPPPCEPADFTEGNYTLGTCGSGFANQSGVASISGLANGTYDVNVFEFNTGGSLFLASNITITNATTSSAVEVTRTFEMPEPGYLTGTVLDAATGNPVANATVEAFGQGWSQGSTDVDGTFNVSTSPGTLGVRIVPPAESGLRTFDTPCDPWSGRGSCYTVTAGNATSLGTISLSAGGSIRGTLTDTDGNPMEGSINAFSMCPPDQPCEPNFGFDDIMPEDNGQFTLSGLGTGNYMVEGFTFSDGQRVIQSDVQVTAGNTTWVNLTVGGGGEIAGTISMPGGSGEVDLIVFEGEVSFETGPGFPLSFARTNADGSYRISGLPSGTVTVMVEPPFGSNAKRAQLTANVTDGNVTWLNHTLTSGKQLKGFVTDSDGNPVANADVGLFTMGPCEAEPCGGFSFSSSTGEFSVGGLEAGTFGMFVGPPPGTGLGSYMADPFTGNPPVQIALNDTVVWRNVTLSSGGTIEGTVSASGGLPGFLWISAFGPSGFSGAPVDADGSYQLEGLPTGTYSVRVEVPPDSTLAPAEADGISVTEGQTSWQNLTLESGVCINGVLSDGSSGVANAFVHAFELIPPGSGRPGGFGFDITAGDGSFGVCGLTDGDYGLRADPAPGSTLGSVERIGITVGDSDVDLGTITLSQAVSVTGRALDGDGNPVMGFVGMWNPETGSGSGNPIGPNGNFQVNVPEGTYEIEVFPDPFMHPNLGVKHMEGQTVGSGGLDLGTLTLTPGASLTGRVVDGDGEGVAYAFVNVEGDGGFGFGSTDPDGNFRVPGLSFEEGSSVDVFIEPPSASEAVATRTTLTWSPGADGSVDAGNLSLSQGQNLTGTVQRQLQDGSLEALNGASIDVWPSSPLPFGGRSTTTASDGSFSLKGMPDGTYDIAVRPSSGPGGFFAENVTIEGADNSTTIVLMPEASLTVTVRNGSGTMEGAEVEVFNGTTRAGNGGQTNATGEVDLPVPPGTYTVKVRAAGHQPSTTRNVEVQAGQSNTLTVTLSEASFGTITATVTNSSGGSDTANVTVVAINDADSFITNFAVSGADGSVTIADVPPGTYTVFATRDGTEVGCTTAVVTDGATTDAGSIDLASACAGDAS